MILSLDLELNQPSGKIIQIGAVVGDSSIVEEFSCIIDPIEPLGFCNSGVHISELTGITEDRIKSEGVSIENGYIKFRDFINKYKISYHVTWGAGDTNCIFKQKPVGIKIKLYKGINAKDVFKTYCLANNLNTKLGLEKAMQTMSLTFEGTAHDALVDAVNTFKIFNELKRKLKEEINFEILGYI